MPTGASEHRGVLCAGRGGHVEVVVKAGDAGDGFRRCSEAEACPRCAWLWHRFEALRQRARIMVFPRGWSGSMYRPLKGALRCWGRAAFPGANAAGLGSSVALRAWGGRGGNRRHRPRFAFTDSQQPRTIGLRGRASEGRTVHRALARVALHGPFGAAGSAWVPGNAPTGPGSLLGRTARTGVGGGS